MRHRLRRVFVFIAVAGLLCALWVEGNRWRRDPSSYEPREGDVILQADLSGRSLAIQVTTLCIFNHVGVVVRENGRFFVMEAIGPVSRTPMDKYIARHGTHGRFAVLRHPKVTPASAAAISRELSRYSGKSYDPGLDWSDARFYCSELVWKAFAHGANIEIAPLVPLRSRHWARFVSLVVPMRYRVSQGDLDDLSVMPAELLRCGRMRVVFRNI